MVGVWLITGRLEAPQSARLAATMNSSTLHERHCHDPFHKKLHMLIFVSCEAPLYLAKTALREEVASRNQHSPTIALKLFIA